MIPVTSPPIDTPLPLFLESEIPANIMAVIQQTVKEITNGKGTVSNVVKI